MAILAAFNSPEVEVIGLTTLFGNVRTPTATANAVFLRELAGRHDVRTDPKAMILPESSACCEPFTARPTL